MPTPRAHARGTYSRASGPHSPRTPQVRPVVVATGKPVPQELGDVSDESSFPAIGNAPTKTPVWSVIEQ